ncbi:hypothetical protein AC249_AIPGENE9423 [Exaiptasia diaphana]|nr:hypothetical protein AC249_AIPGENE9423 [Exaiptasia diaphana]
MYSRADLTKYLVEKVLQGLSYIVLKKCTRGSGKGSFCLDSSSFKADTGLARYLIPKPCKISTFKNVVGTSGKLV